MAANRSSTKQSTKETKSDLAVSYDEFKEHEGQRYDDAHRPQIQNRAQARRQREVERYAADATQANDHVPARCSRRSREADRSRGDSDRRAGRAAAPGTPRVDTTLQASGHQLAP